MYIMLYNNQISLCNNLYNIISLFILLFPSFNVWSDYFFVCTEEPAKVVEAKLLVTLSSSNIESWVSGDWLMKRLTREKTPIQYFYRPNLSAFWLNSKNYGQLTWITSRSGRSEVIYKKLFRKFSQVSQGNMCANFSFPIKL